MHFDRQISRFSHGWRAGEGFDFVCEALDIGFSGSLGFSGSGAEAADPEPASYQYTRLPPPSSCGSWRRPHEISVEPRQLKRKVKRWEGQRPRCPCNDESGSGDAAPPGVATKRPMTK
ncbi:MAG: hypothetical protein IKC27_04190 [Kiritimatiellae bacterium]|nr:hypothetical protein [Kiritimatiellia bacterium]